MSNPFYPEPDLHRPSNYRMSAHARETALRAINAWRSPQGMDPKPMIEQADEFRSVIYALENADEDDVVSLTLQDKGNIMMLLNEMTVSGSWGLVKEKCREFAMVDDALSRPLD